MQPPSQQGQCARHPDRVAETVCPRCGNFTCGECNPDGRSLCPSCLALGEVQSAGYTPTPWERRAELGFFQGLFQTFKKTLLEPATFWPSVPPDGPMGDALVYSWLLAAATAILTIPMTWLNFAQMQTSMKDLSSAMSQMKEIAELFERFGEAPLLFAIGVAVFTILFFPVGLVIGAGLTTLGGMLFGANDRGFNATFRAVAYAQAPNVFSLVPVAGPLVATVWTVVSEVWAIKDMQKTSVMRAIGAVLWFAVFTCCCLGVLGIAAAVIIAKGR